MSFSLDDKLMQNLNIIILIFEIKQLLYVICNSHMDSSPVRFWYYWDRKNFECLLCHKRKSQIFLNNKSDTTMECSLLNHIHLNVFLKHIIPHYFVNKNICQIRHSRSFIKHFLFYVQKLIFIHWRQYVTNNILFFKVKI